MNPTSQKRGATEVARRHRAEDGIVRVASVPERGTPDIVTDEIFDGFNRHR